MTLTLRADCPDCAEGFRVPISRVTSDRPALHCDTEDVQKAYDDHCAQAPEKHPEVGREAAKADATA